MVERVSGTIPQFMTNQAPPDVRNDMFDERGRVKADLVAPERQSRVARLMLLPVRIYTASSSNSVHAKMSGERILLTRTMVIATCLVRAT